ncbi:MAG TPA: septation protein IspZ [Caulobacteraceae bacterium]
MTDQLSPSAALTALKRLALDVLSGWLFLAVFLITSNIYLATAVGVATGVGQTIWAIWRKQAVEPMRLMAVGLVVVLGGATILFHNPTFAVFKPTIFEGCLAAMMLRPGWMARYVPARAVEFLPPGLMVFWGYLWAVAWFVLAASNLLVARVYGLKAWAIYTNVSPMVLVGSLFGLGLLIFPPMVRRIARERGVVLSRPA